MQLIMMNEKETSHMPPPSETIISLQTIHEVHDTDKDIKKQQQFFERVNSLKQSKGLFYDNISICHF